MPAIREIDLAAITVDKNESGRWNYDTMNCAARVQIADELKKLREELSELVSSALRNESYYCELRTWAGHYKRHYRKAAMALGAKHVGTWNYMMKRLAMWAWRRSGNVEIGKRMLAQINWPDPWVDRSIGRARPPEYHMKRWGEIIAKAGNR